MNDNLELTVLLQTMQLPIYRSTSPAIQVIVHNPFLFTFDNLTCVNL